tara:strand:+ start:593 stop:1126 length:534 start_codon:yes stop_codon:yes gene_type:complete
MKITKNQLKHIINEELDIVMTQEGIFFDNPIADKLRGRRPRAPEPEITDEDNELSYEIGELKYADDLDLNPRSLAKLRIDQPGTYQALQMIVDKEIDYGSFSDYSDQLIRKVYDAKIAKRTKDDRDGRAQVAQRNKDSIIAAREKEKEADDKVRRAAADEEYRAYHGRPRRNEALDI